jgi:hypothetical protein
MRFSPEVEFFNQQPIFHMHISQGQDHQRVFFFFRNLKTQNAIAKIVSSKISQKLSESSLHMYEQHIINLGWNIFSVDMRGCLKTKK